eukprot:g6266.t1
MSCNICDYDLCLSCAASTMKVSKQQDFEDAKKEKEFEKEEVDDQAEKEEQDEEEEMEEMEEEEDNDIIEVDMHKHPLSRIFREDGYICDQCDREFSASKCMSCNICDYDLCLSCAASTMKVSKQQDFEDAKKEKEFEKEEVDDQAEKEEQDEEEEMEEMEEEEDNDIIEVDMHKHPLSRIFREDGYICDQCDREFSASKCMSCNICDYDLCLSCAASTRKSVDDSYVEEKGEEEMEGMEEEEDNDIIEVDVHKHPLSRIFREDGYICDQCDREFSASKCMSCNICDYDLCLSCAGSLKVSKAIHIVEKEEEVDVEANIQEESSSEEEEESSSEEEEESSSEEKEEQESSSEEEEESSSEEKEEEESSSSDTSLFQKVAVENEEGNDIIKVDEEEEESSSEGEEEESSEEEELSSQESGTSSLQKGAVENEEDNDIIKVEDHEHLLHRAFRKDGFICDQCDKEFSASKCLTCNLCDYDLCLSCAALLEKSNNIMEESKIASEAADGNEEELITASEDQEEDVINEEEPGLHDIRHPHMLALAGTLSHEYTCDICNLNRTGKVFRCQSCDYDACPFCIAADKVRLSKYSSILTAVEVDRNVGLLDSRYECSICNDRRQGRRYLCSESDIHVCPGCVSEEREKDKMIASTSLNDMAPVRDIFALSRRLVGKASGVSDLSSASDTDVELSDFDIVLSDDEDTQRHNVKRRGIWLFGEEDTENDAGFSGNSPRLRPNKLKRKRKKRKKKSIPSAPQNWKMTSSDEESQFSKRGRRTEVQQAEDRRRSLHDLFTPLRGGKEAMQMASRGISNTWSPSY